LFQDAVAREACPVPGVRLLCTDFSVLGGAFTIMDFMPGRPLLLSIVPEAMPGVVAGFQVALHRINPAPLMESFRQCGPGISDCRFRLTTSLVEPRMLAGRYPRLFPPIVGWLVTHFPGDPERLSICHGDLHPLNILVRNDRVTGVVDWTNATVADPMLDIAGTSLILALASRHFPSWANPHRMVKAYLDCYRNEMPVAPDRLDYYRVYWCAMRLAKAVTGRGIWKNPQIVRSLLADIGRLTGIALPNALEPESMRSPV